MMTTEEESASCDETTGVREDSHEQLGSKPDQDDKLIVTAWYSMCVALQEQERRPSGCPSRTPDQAQSFLAQQRQYTQSRSRKGLSPNHKPK
ncbi:hypothetical protein DPEC_G00172750 [Dallia pectoralis]|uniref:Uncharacterized protein n=1 Tax=Dallia pectoralis TaxID=75939 RepID=A0ACC2GDQ7_DALPE|nr:hypothetical protein DPEC_G00172750 [Dallia pectoralis]